MATPKRARPTHVGGPPTKQRRLMAVSVPTPAGLPSQMVQQCGHFRLKGSPKRKDFKPRKHVQTAVDELWWCQKDASRPSVTDFDHLLRSIQEKNPSFSVRKFSNAQNQTFWATVDAGLTLNSPLSTPIPNPRLVLTAPANNLSDMRFTLEAHFMAVTSGRVQDAEFDEYLQSLLPGSGYYLCEGITQEVAANFSSDVKNLRRWGHPLHRIDHDQCLMWFRLSKVPLNLKYGVRCSMCRKLHHYLVSELSRRQKIAPEQKAKRVLPSSNYPIKYLSPLSKEKRYELIRQERTCTKMKLHKYERYDTNVGDASNEELLAVVSQIHHKSRSELDALLTKADKVGKGDILRDKWKQDVEDRILFNRDQQRNVTGRRGNRWSMITIRMALAIYCRSPAAFEALSSFKLLQLPGAYTLKTYTRSNKEDPGECANRLAHERALYDERVCEEKKRGNPLPPLNEGVLIADEVKVAAKLHWNSRDDNIVGTSMTPDEMSTLQDLYMALDDDPSTSKADYVLQTLWRDFSTNHDIVGPYYTSSGTFGAKFMLACLMDSLQHFHAFGFKISLVIVDGASANLSCIKLLLGVKGVFGHEQALTDQHSIPTSITNPFTGDKLFFMICPSHQLKNMIAALYSSRSKSHGSPNKFVLDGENFGWESIEGLLAREVKRISQNHLPRVPGLKESHVFRDPWTRLNVKPAKIMQQEHVLAELQEYATQTPPPSDAKSVLQLVAYLTACNQLFERGILGKNVFINSIDCPILDNMDKGFKFFADWLDVQLSKGYSITATIHRPFLSWQTWDLLRVMYYGFKEFCLDFLNRHPGYTIHPIRLNGSAIESFFSQLKHATSNQLSSTNYATARAAILTRGSIQDKAHHDDYRKCPLNIRKHALLKTEYKKCS